MFIFYNLLIICKQATIFLFLETFQFNIKIFFLKIISQKQGKPQIYKRLGALKVCGNIYEKFSSLNFLQKKNYNCGPAATNALPSSLSVNLVKFLMKREAKSFAFSVQASVVG